MTNTQEPQNTNTSGVAGTVQTVAGAATGLKLYDTDMLAVMEDLLDTWPGTLIVVSHDRYLLERELVLIKVAADESNRSDVLEIVRLFRVRVVDVNPESLTIEATGAEGKIDALLGLLEHYGIIELVRSGAVAVTRGPKALSEKVLGSEITGR